MAHKVWPLCGHCSARGELKTGSYTFQVCPACGGSGRIPPVGWGSEMQAAVNRAEYQMASQASWPRCSSCGGRGAQDGVRCEHCKGLGRVSSAAFEPAEGPYVTGHEAAAQLGVALSDVITDADRKNLEPAARDGFVMVFRAADVAAWGKKLGAKVVA